MCACASAGRSVSARVKKIIEQPTQYYHVTKSINIYNRYRCKGFKDYLAREILIIFSLVIIQQIKLFIQGYPAD